MECVGDVFLNICWNNSKRELSAFFANATSFYIISISLIICLFLSPLSASKSLHFLPIVSSSTFVMLISSHLFIHYLSFCVIYLFSSLTCLYSSFLFSPVLLSFLLMFSHLLSYLSFFSHHTFFEWLQQFLYSKSYVF